MKPLTHSDKNLFSLITTDSLRDFSQLFEDGEYVNRNAINKDGRTFFGEAVAQGAVKITDFLCKYPELVKLEDQKKKFGFFYISRAKNQKFILATLVKNKIDLASLTTESRNVLHEIAPMGKGELFMTLVKLGVDSDKEDIVKQTPKDIAKRYNNFSIITMSQIDEFGPK